MTRITPVSKEKASSKVKPLFEAIEKKLGRIPNIFLNMGNSSAVLEGYLSLSKAADDSTLSPKLREQLALVIGEANKCNYCLSAHSAIGKSIGLAETAITDARKGLASDKKEQAILQFAKKAVEKRGLISKEEVEALKKEGVTDQELTEIILIIALNTFTNYFNHITDPVIDFPVAAKTV